MLAFLKLTRPLNLVIIIITMAAMRYGVIGAYLEVSTIELRSMATPPDATVFEQIPENMFFHAFRERDFWLLVISTVLIAAGGYVINDYFDTRIDRINKPDDLIVGRTVKRRVAMMGHLVLSGLGLLVGAFVAWHSGQLKWALIPVFAIGSLWFYSTNLKRTFLMGNGLVALLSGLIPLTVGLYEIPMLVSKYAANTTLITTDGHQVEAMFHFDVLWPWILAYAGFAFITTLVRELQKDLADVKGDEADGCRTVPIVWGARAAKTMALVYIAATIIAVLMVRTAFLRDPLSFWTIGLGVIGPLLLSAGFTFNAQDRRGYMIAANLMKGAMVVAVIYAFFIGHALA